MGCLKGFDGKGLKHHLQPFPESTKMCKKVYAYG